MVLNAVLGHDVFKFWGGFTWQCCTYSMWEPFLCVGINMKLVVLYRDRFNWSTPLTRRMAASAYTAYIVHAFFVATATYLFTFFSLGRLPEILLMWPVAVIPCFLFSDVVRRLPLLRKIL
jgi:surface polysaccharide O-acyltransferase-like enzyme